jgi:hypothetical protein
MFQNRDLEHMAPVYFGYLADSAAGSASHGCLTVFSLSGLFPSRRSSCIL